MHRGTGNTSCVFDAPGCLEKPGKYNPSKLTAATGPNQALPSREVATKSPKPSEVPSLGTCWMQEQQISLKYPWLSLWGQQEEGQGTFGV